MKTLTRARACLLAFLLAAGAVTILGGCGGAGYTGGGFPPGPADIGGVVVTDAVPSLSSGRGQQGQSGVQGAQVTLIQGHHGQVEQTDTGPHGYFRFDNPPTGNYKLFVKPPAGSGLDGARTQFAHVHGKQTFLKIVLHKHGG